MWRRRQRREGRGHQLRAAWSPQKPPLEPAEGVRPCPTWASEPHSNLRCLVSRPGGTPFSVIKPPVWGTRLKQPQDAPPSMLVA